MKYNKAELEDLGLIVARLKIMKKEKLNIHRKKEAKIKY